MITLGEEFDDKAKGGRKLTENELSLARSVFGDKIDYDKVRVHGHNIPGFGTTAITPNGKIYLPEDKYQEDMTVSFDSRGLFIHEMTHVWQHQQGRSVVGEAIGQTLREAFNYKAAYKYDVDEVKDFNDLNLEQQAELIQHHYQLQERGYESNSRRAILAAADMDFTVCPLDQNVATAKNNSQPEVPQRNF